MGYRCEHFIIQELVPKSVYDARGELAWQLLDPAVCHMLDLLRKRYGPITVNNWHAGGAFSESGLRDPFTTTGAQWSMHKFGKANDCKFKDATPGEVGNDLLAHPEYAPLITCIENPAITKTWLHVDTRNHNDAKQIIVVNP